jgi:hypothetical protein
MTDQTPEAKTSKKLEEKQQRRQAEERKAAEIRSAKRKRSLVTLGLALLVGALVVGLILSERKSTEFTGGVVEAEAGCSDIEEFPLGEANHVDEGTDIQYASAPPTSGDHYAAPSSPAFFSAPVEEERLVHNLEHGQIVIWYSPEAGDEVINDIEGYVLETQDQGIVAAPYDALEDGTYAIGAWGAAQTCEKVSAEVIDAFRVQYQGKGPEQIAPPYTPEENA